MQGNFGDKSAATNRLVSHPRSHFHDFSQFFFSFMIFQISFDYIISPKPEGWGLILTRWQEKTTLIQRSNRRKTSFRLLTMESLPLGCMLNHHCRKTLFDSLARILRQYQKLHEQDTIRPGIRFCLLFGAFAPFWPLVAPKNWKMPRCPVFAPNWKFHRFIWYYSIFCVLIYNFPILMTNLFSWIPITISHYF